MLLRCTAMLLALSLLLVGCEETAGSRDMMLPDGAPLQDQGMLDLVADGSMGDAQPSDVGVGDDSTIDVGASDDSTVDSGGTGDSMIDSGGTGDSTIDVGTISDSTSDLGSISDSTSDVGASDDSTVDSGGTGACGDGICNAGETCATCASDCSRCPQSGDTCNVLGGGPGSPTDLGAFIASNSQCTVFVLGYGGYQALSITRPGIIVRAENPCGAMFANEIQINAQNVVVDGVSITAEGVALSVSSPGVHVRNCCIQGFGKTTYGNGIWVYQQALDENNRIYIVNNKLDDWGGYMYSGGIAIGKAADDPYSHSQITVEVRHNQITNGPYSTTSIWNAAIQSFHPFIAYGNYIHTVNGEAIQNKTFNSVMACNEAVNVIGDGALYNRTDSNNVWEHNIVRDSYMGIDIFMGDGNVFRGNVIYNCEYIGRIKNQGPGTTNLTIEDNTFYNTSGWAGWIWDSTSSGTLSNIVWRRNIFHSINGAAIANSNTSAWDEYDNVFFNSSPPSGTTGAGGSSVVVDPQFPSPPSDFTVTNPAASDRGAAWPLPCTP